MANIKTEHQYTKALERIEELLQIVGNDTRSDNKDFVELDLLSDLVAEHEEVNFPVAQPSLSNVIRLRMVEMGITQKKLAELLTVSPSRISEYMTGKSEPSLKVARLLHHKLNVDADIFLA